MARHVLDPRTTDRFPHSAHADPSKTVLEGSAGERLRSAIENVYLSFRESRLAQPRHYCPHCFTAFYAEYVTKTPLRNLTFSDISYILPKAATTLGTDADFNYFLPRILEAWAYQAHYLLEALPSRLKSARATGRSDPQLSAVVEFMTAYVEAVNEMPDNASAVSELENMLAELREALPELSPYFVLRLNETA